MSGVVVDTHVHGPDFVPQPFRRVYRFINRTTMPADVGFDVLRPGGVDAVVGKAVGDPVVTRWYRGGAWSAVAAQLDQLRAGIGAVDGVVATDEREVREAKANGRPALILGVEGADAIGSDVSRLDAWHAAGVRVVVLVHLGDNQIGTTCLPWQRYVGPLPVGRRPPTGLTDFGRAVVERINRLGMVIDVSHADGPTLFDIVAASRQPVIASHSGARVCQDFARYLTDDEAEAVARTGGVIGLWPYNHRGKGAADMDALMAHACHLRGIVGAEHLCLGTDMNGVPGVMDGYRDERDVPKIVEALRGAGFSATEVDRVVGENFLRVLAAVTG